jgi:hypothetical protein
MTNGDFMVNKWTGNLGIMGSMLEEHFFFFFFFFSLKISIG